MERLRRTKDGPGRRRQRRFHPRRGLRFQRRPGLRRAHGIGRDSGRLLDGRLGYNSGARRSGRGAPLAGCRCRGTGRWRWSWLALELRLDRWLGLRLSASQRCRRRLRGLLRGRVRRRGGPRRFGGRSRGSGLRSLRRLGYLRSVDGRLGGRWFDERLAHRGNERFDHGRRGGRLRRRGGLRGPLRRRPGPYRSLRLPRRRGLAHWCDESLARRIAGRIGGELGRADRRRGWRAATTSSHRSGAGGQVEADGSAHRHILAHLSTGRHRGRSGLVNRAALRPRRHRSVSPHPSPAARRSADRATPGLPSDLRPGRSHRTPGPSRSC